MVEHAANVGFGLPPAVHKKAAREGGGRTWQVDGAQPLGMRNSNAQEGCRNGGGILFLNFCFG
jgi:hypothetical protein